MTADENQINYQQMCALEGAARYLQESGIDLVPSHVSRIGKISYSSEFHKRGIPKITETDRRKSVLVDDKSHSDIFNILKEYGEIESLPDGWVIHREDVYITPVCISLGEAVLANERDSEVQIPLFDAEIVVRNPQGTKYRATVPMNENLWIDL